MTGLEFVLQSSEEESKRARCVGLKVHMMVVLMTMMMVLVIQTLTCSLSDRVTRCSSRCVSAAACVPAEIRQTERAH